jgi:Tol biopolymer transport system component
VVFDPAKYHGMLGEQPFWSSDGRELYFKAHDAAGRAQFWSVPVAGGSPTLLLTLDNPAQSSFRPEWALRAGRMYFTVDDRQSDVWVMHVTPR